METFRSLVLESPLAAFTIMLLVSLTLPQVFERLRLPGLVGLLFAGVILGPNVLGLLDANGETEKLFSDIGKIYLMFVAALEIDLKEFSRSRDRSLTFGFLTFAVPMIGGTLLGRWIGFGWNSSVLIGSLMASHTLLAYPIVMRLGVSRNEAVTVTVGATIFTDIAALLVLAVCVSIHGGEFSTLAFTGQLISLAIYAAVILFGLDWAGKRYFQQAGDDQGNKFLFILLAVFLSAAGAQIINVDKIVGAFLAGLAVNDVVGDGPVKEKVEFFGSVLFIPFFFICMGLLLDVPIFIEALTTRLAVTVGIVATLMLTKLGAAAIAAKLFRYSWTQMWTMWSLSLPQVAATLAAALVGLQVGLLTPTIFNGVIVLMLVTSLAGSIITGRVARNLPLSSPIIHSTHEDDWADWLVPDLPKAGPFTVVVPISNPVTQRYLIEMAALIARYKKGQIIPVAIAPAHVHMDDPKLVADLGQARQLLRAAEAISTSLGTPAYPRTRIGDDVAAGISRTAREQNAQLIVMGWSPSQGLRAKLFGTLIDDVFWAAHCPVAVTRLKTEPVNMRRILIPVKTITPQTIRTIRFGQVFADTHAAAIILLHVCDRHTPESQIVAFKQALEDSIQQGPAVNYELEVSYHDDPAAVILKASRTMDLVILRSMRRRTAGGLAVSDVTHEVLAGLTCSVVLFGEPHT
ncbi:cation:proton antiporter [Leptolyngbya sp. PCC 6406]|uniref:cation:proton antiporter n=1 Tax=Leptolyngbya sp. PCC 6406 TaxID=1173264 RepID=UPI0002AD0CB9|nr:cation:proton antiporter [Leptolyngbya sp. PCC 6406]